VLVLGGSLRLVDYDGMFVPRLGDGAKSRHVWFSRCAVCRVPSPYEIASRNPTQRLWRWRLPGLVVAMGAHSTPPRMDRQPWRRRSPPAGLAGGGRDAEDDSTAATVLNRSVARNASTEATRQIGPRRTLRLASGSMAEARLDKSVRPPVPPIAPTRPAEMEPRDRWPTHGQDTLTDPSDRRIASRGGILPAIAKWERRRQSQCSLLGAAWCNRRVHKFGARVRQGSEAADVTAPLSPD
jgi:hypothetical protein